MPRQLWRVAIGFFVGVSLLTMALSVVAAPNVGATALSFRYARGWTVQGGWLCYGYNNGYYHCTAHWYRTASGLYVSLNPSFVPSQTTVTPTGSGAASPPSSGGCSANGLPSVGNVANGWHWAPGGIPNDSCVAVRTAPAGIRLWATPPAPFDKVYYINPALYPGRGGWPTCSWWAREVSVAFGHNTGSAHSTPKIGAAIHYAPGVLGASSDGHYGHVVAIYSNGWLLSSEMNFWWRGGGSGRVIFRFIPAHAAGVSYIY